MDVRLLSSFATATSTNNLSTVEGESNTAFTTTTSTTATTITTAAAAISATTTSPTSLVAATTTATEAIEGVVDEVLLSDNILISTMQSELYTRYYQKISTKPSLLRETIDSGSITVRRTNNNGVSNVESNLLKLKLKEMYEMYMNDMQFISVIHSIIHD